MGSQLRGIADAGKHQELWRVDRAAGEYDFAPGKGPHRVAAAGRVFDADCAITVKQHTVDQRTDFDTEIGAAQRWSQVSDRGATPAAVADRHLPPREAFLLAAVEVVSPPVAGRGARGRESFDDRIGKACIPRRQRAIAAAIGIGAAFPAFLPPEIGQHMCIGPLCEACGGPAIVIAAMAANVRHRVDRGRPADYFAARDFDLPAVHARLWIGRIHPIVHAPRHHAAPGQRNVDPGIAIPASGFEHEDARVPAQPVCQRAAAGAGAHDDEIIFGCIGGARHGVIVVPASATASSAKARTLQILHCLIMVRHPPITPAWEWRRP